MKIYPNFHKEVYQLLAQNWMKSRKIFIISIFKNLLYKIYSEKIEKKIFNRFFRMQSFTSFPRDIHNW